MAAVAEVATEVHLKKGQTMKMKVQIDAVDEGILRLTRKTKTPDQMT